ncbi:monothiol glutaredoxin-S7, chloroplastic-like [Hordeum vulgare subsp. vulgare]|uniref:Glutaredoxin domain-containing protein n=1 Tax=Hordeum vulgare subsp. vulgare TaxID=112509 RepID=A0A8I7BAJ4_HORVV|nr:monothiol glutaredoxin-S7, chloroplastic-like [Hordeum vulgare subsp. vulgare]
MTVLPSSQPQPRLIRPLHPSPPARDLHKPPAAMAAATALAGASLPLPLSARPRPVRFSVALPRTAPPPPALRLRSVRRLAATEGGGGGVAAGMKETLDKVVTAHKVVLFMKGTKDFPQCGFSHTVVQILRSLDVPFETLDVLANDALRQGLKEYSSWPTFPQLYIDGEFFGGCDITLEAYKSGELQETLEKAMCS